MAEVRGATGEDAPGILDIYAPYILGGASTFETIVPAVDEFAARIEKYTQKFPWIVCRVQEKLAAYVYASSHREREAYQWTCESSVYVHEQFKGRGIGKALYMLLFRLLQLQGLKNVYAGITLPNEASENLHRACGFERFAVYDHVGYKLHAWHQVGWWRLQLGTYEPEPAPPLSFPALDPEVVQQLFESAARQIGLLVTG